MVIRPNFIAFLMACTFKAATFKATLSALFLYVTLMAAAQVTTPGQAHAANTGQDPAQVITALGQDLGALAAHTTDMSASQRLDSVEVLLNLYFDLNRISANAIGSRRFHDMSADQQAEYIKAYSRFMVASYISRLPRFQASGLNVAETMDGPQGMKLVRAEYRNNSGEATRLDFILVPKSSTWQVVDVRQDGAISEIALRHAEVSSVYKRDGYDGLIALLKKKTQALASR